jgi:predicted ABC-type ATPase
MGDKTPRLRMFAGPNGSGKSSIKDDLPPGMLGFYVNPDEIEKVIRKQNYFDLKVFQLETTSEAILSFFCTSKLLIDDGFLLQAQQLTFSDGKLHFGNVKINSYFASVLSDFIRKKLLEEKISFTFETVMSSSDKVDFLKLAQESGFRTYLYYVSTEDPAINVSRVRLRVSKGGHSVPEDKIICRYYRSLGFLYDASKFANRAYVFDNSTIERLLVAEMTEGDFLEMKTESMPIWFKTALWDKF